MAEIDDPRLVSALQSGDTAALGAMYDRYGDRLFDFSYSVLRDRDAAADAVQDTFVLAANKIDQLRDPSRLRPWLYSIARHVSYRQLERRQRATPVADLPEAAEETDLGQAMSSQELQALVWDAAAGLADRDRMLLDLHVRQGLDGPDLAAAMGEDQRNPYSMLSRMKQQLEKSLRALTVARAGSDECPELESILEASGWDGTMTPLLRKRVARHIDSCEICSETERRVGVPLALYATIPAAGAVPGLRERVLAAADRALRGSASAEAARADVVDPGDPLTAVADLSTGWTTDGFPPGEPKGGPAVSLFAKVAVVFALFIGAAVLFSLLWNPGGGDELVVASGPSAVEATPSVEPDPSPTSTPGVDAPPAPTPTDEPTVAVEVPQSDDPDPTPVPVIPIAPPEDPAATPTSSPTPTATPVPPVDRTPPETGAVAVIPTSICATDPGLIAVQVEIGDDSPNPGGTVSWFIDNGRGGLVTDINGSTSTSLVPTGGVNYEATIGPLSQLLSPQTATIRVEAVDAAGNAAPPVDVPLPVVFCIP